MNHLMKTKKVLLSRMLPEIGAELLRDSGFSVTCWNEDRPMTQEELIEYSKKHDALFCTITEKLDKNFLASAPIWKLYHNLRLDMII
jgi:glyoxylate reductase